MTKVQFDAKFDAAFHNALRHSYQQIAMPDENAILESWRTLQTKLTSYRLEPQGIEK